LRGVFAENLLPLAKLVALRKAGGAPGPRGSDYEACWRTACGDAVAAEVAQEAPESGMRRPAQSGAGCLYRTKAGAVAAEAQRAAIQTADHLIRAQADAGMNPGPIARHQKQIAASLLSGAKTTDRHACAREYAGTAGTDLYDRGELDQPAQTQRTPGPGQALHADGCHLRHHGTYTRHPDGEFEAEPEAC
jgi:hypothetical protein